MISFVKLIDIIALSKSTKNNHIITNISPWLKWFLLMYDSLTKQFEYNVYSYLYVMISEYKPESIWCVNLSYFCTTMACWMAKSIWKN